MLYESLNIYKIIITQTIGTFFLNKSHNYIGIDKGKKRRDRKTEYLSMPMSKWQGWELGNGWSGGDAQIAKLLIED